MIYVLTDKLPGNLAVLQIISMSAATRPLDPIEFAESCDGSEVANRRDKISRFRLIQSRNTSRLSMVLKKS